MTKNTLTKLIVTGIGVAFFWLICLIAYYSFTKNLHIKYAINQFIESLYFHPHPNIFENGEFLGQNVYAFLYLITIVTFLTMIIIRRSFAFKNDANIFHLIIISILSVTVLTTTFQTAEHYGYWHYQMMLFEDKSIDRKNQIIAGDKYDFAQFCKQNLPQNASAEFITDVDITTDPGMLWKVAIAYHLYPIDIRGIRKEQKDYILYFMKENAESFIPEDFRVLAKIDDENLIAVRE